MKLRNVTMLAAAVSFTLVAVTAMAAERDPLKPRAPASARADVNPTPSSPASIEKGKELFEELGCNGCHGDGGTGDGPAAAGLDPSPRNFTNPAWQDARKDGELRYTDFKGSEGTAMIANESMYDDPNDVWDVINYIRSLKKGS
jgi:mono/diheme cytochrome c family protein